MYEATAKRIEQPHIMDVFYEIPVGDDHPDYGRQGPTGGAHPYQGRQGPAGNVPLF